MLGPHVVGQRVVVRRVLRGETGPERRTGDDRRARHLHVVGRRDLRRPAGDRSAVDDRASPTSCPASRSRRARRPATGSRRGRGPAARARALAGPDDRAARRLDAAPLRPPRPPGAPTPCSRSSRPGVDDDLERGRRASTRPGPAGRSPPCCRTPPRTRSSAATAGSWRATTRTRSSRSPRSRSARRGRPLGAAARRVDRTTRTATWSPSGSATGPAGVAAYADDWVGFRSIEVAPEHRRQGLGLAVMAALLEWGAERGATHGVPPGPRRQRPGAGALRRLGFVTHHAYRYLARAVGWALGGRRGLTHRSCRAHRPRVRRTDDEAGPARVRAGEGVVAAAI